MEKDKNQVILSVTRHRQNPLESTYSAMAQAVSRRLPTAAARVRAQFRSCGICGGETNWHWGRFSPSTSVSPANLHPTDCSILIIYHPGLVQWAKQWPTYQVGSVSPHPKKLKNYDIYWVFFFCWWWQVFSFNFSSSLIGFRGIVSCYKK
jgi:hypothetical protein